MERASGMTCKEICNIIAVCRKHGVKKFTLEDLSFELDMTPAPQITSHTEFRDPPREFSIGGDGTFLQHTGGGLELTPEQQLEIEKLKAEEEIEQIKLLDPERYEQLLAEGQIEDVHDEQDDRGA